MLLSFRARKVERLEFWACMIGNAGFKIWIIPFDTSSVSIISFLLLLTVLIQDLVASLLMETDTY